VYAWFRVPLYPAAQGFAAAPDAYDRGRPDYPAEAVRVLAGALGLRAGRVLELGAGTGKLTRLLAPAGAVLLALEPVAAMRRKLAGNAPAAVVVAGVAEAIPLRAGSLDAVVAAQAFHWFDGPRALAEVHRVLRPGGRLALAWNVRDERVDWLRRLTEIIDPYEAGAPRYRTGAWKAAFEAHPGFTPLALERFTHVQRAASEQVVDRVASISFIAALPAEPRAAVLADVRQLLAAHPQTAGRAEIEVAYRTDVFTCERRE
jgi:SAM-dependent methyltransferase